MNLGPHFLYHIDPVPLSQPCWKVTRLLFDTGWLRWVINHHLSKTPDYLCSYSTVQYGLIDWVKLGRQLLRSITDKECLKSHGESVNLLYPSSSSSSSISQYLSLCFHPYLFLSISGLDKGLQYFTVSNPPVAVGQDVKGSIKNNMYWWVLQSPQSQSFSLSLNWYRSVYLPLSVLAPSKRVYSTVL